MASIFTQKATAGGQERVAATAGSHPAVLVAIVDLGTHTDTYGDDTYTVRKIFLAWELTDEDDPATGQRYVVGRDYSLSFGPKAALRALVKDWRGVDFKEGEEFDLLKLKGQPCLLNLVHKTTKTGKAVAQVSGAQKLPKGMKPEAAQHAPFVYEIDPSEAGKPELPDWLPYLYGKSLADKIAASKELQAAAAGGNAGGEDEGEVGDDHGAGEAPGGGPIPF